jgi:uncharacterized protein
MQSHDLYLQVGYGLEGAIPDAIAKRIISNEIVPRFRQGDMDGGMTAAVNAMIAATKGEYQGSGRTVAEQRGSPRDGGGGVFTALVIFAILAFLVFAFIRSLIRRALRPTIFNNPRRRGPVVIWNDNNWWGGGGGGGSSWGGGGGGGFSGGGGSFGGGGAGGKW